MSRPGSPWLLRMARLTAGGGHSQAAVGAALRATGVRTHARPMSEVENGKVRHGRIIDGYERALGLRDGQLRAPVDVLCRSLPGGPPDRDDAGRAVGGELLSVDELGRSVGTACVTRYEPLSLVRASSYGHLVLAAARRAVADPHAQVLVDAVTATADRPTPEVLGWTAELLADHRPMAVRASCHALV